MSNGTRRRSPVHVVFDTNIWISFLLGKRTAPGLRRALREQRVIPLFSDELFHEVFDVLERPKFAGVFASADIDELRLILKLHGVWPKIDETIRACDDPKDDFLLKLAVGGRAGYLVTGDAALLRLDPFRDTRIVRFRDFVDNHLQIELDR